MKFFCRALCVLLIANSFVLAQEEDVETSVADFAPLDDDLVLYIPKFAVKIGFRGIDGVQTSFGGTGLISSLAELGADTGIAQRLYHDGFVGLDTRTVIDPAGNPVPISPDGRTNTWGFDSSTQATADGYMTMHSYSATTTDTSFREKDPSYGFGVELSFERDLGKLFGTRITWAIAGGMSINQINTATTGEFSADVVTTTDYYSLLGQAAPEAPFSGPGFTGAVDTTPLLGSELLLRTIQTSSTPAAILSSWKLKGAYLTFRAGPSLFIPITSRFSASVSAGAVLVYAGTTYDVTQSFKPNTGDAITESFTSNDDAFLPGFYVDASLQFAMNETAGLYLGAVYQSSGDYIQDAVSEDGESVYSTRVDLSKLQGVRAGVSFKF